MKPITYINGNRLVKVYPSGGRERYRLLGDTTPYTPDRPETIDINISYRCRLGCPWCYLGASPGGDVFEFTSDTLDKLDRIFSEDIIGMEVALNYNDGDSIDTIYDLVEYFAAKGAFSRVTVNYGSFFHVYRTFLLHYTYSSSWENIVLGVSVGNAREIRHVLSIEPEIPIVFHIVNGIFPKDDLSRIYEQNILILGYKTIGRGSRYKPQEFFTKGDLEILRSNNNTVVLDILAVEQLGVTIDPEYYLGRDGEVSMYLDLVRWEYGVSSTDTTRFPVEDKTLRQMFAHVRNMVGR